MQNLKRSLLMASFVGLLLISCHKDDNVNPTLNNDSDIQMYSKIITVHDSDGKKSGKLKLNASSEALLKDIEFDFQFTLTKSTTLSEKSNGLISSDSDGEDVDVTETKNKTFSDLSNAVWVDLIPETPGDAVALQVKKSVATNGRVQEDFRTVVIGGHGWRYIRVDNYAKNPIHVSTLYKGCVLRDICIAYTHEGDFYDYFNRRNLKENKHTWITYCSDPVLAIISYDRSKAYDWKYNMSSKCKD
jgi:hypothetical protein